MDRLFAHTLCGLFGACLTCAVPGTATAASTGEPEANAASRHPADNRAAVLQTVVVTGTRAPDRTAADSMAPIDVLTQEDLATTGAPDLAQALRILLPAFNYPQPSINGSTDSTQPAQLRGLSPDQVLVLVNGKRQHTTSLSMVTAPLSIGRGASPVDLSAIPVNAIARVEVLRDGAAAQYGSDAIAGVINIILNGGAGHGSAQTGLGRHDGGQGRTWHGGADGGFAFGDAGWVHLAANYVNQMPTQHADVDWRYPGDPIYGKHSVRYGLPRLVARMAAVNAQYRLGEHATLYGFTLFNQRETTVGEAFRAVSTYAATSPAAVAVYPAGFLPMIHSAVRDDNEVLGLRGRVGEWHYDLSVDSGGNHWKPHTLNSFNFDLGAASPTQFYTGTLAIRQNEYNLDVGRDFMLDDAGSLSVAWGLASRHEDFSIKTGDWASMVGTGAEAVGGGFLAGDAGSHARHNRAGYMDLEYSPGRHLSAGLAVRRERYSDFGGTTSWKLSGRYAFAPALAVRATASTGFRAPSLQQEFYSSTGVVFDDPADPKSWDVVRTFPVSDPVAVALGAQPLQPEQSRNYSIGWVYTSAMGPYATLDLYQIDVDDRIILSGDLIGAPVREYLTRVGFPGVSGGRFFTNAANTRTRGADLVAGWPLSFRRATLTLTAGANWNKTELRSIKPNPQQLGLAGLQLPILNRAERGRITRLSPRSKLFAAARWQRGNWRVNAQATRYGQWFWQGWTPAGDQTFGARVLLDASVGYAWSAVSLTLGANNLTNVYPDRNNAVNSYGGQLVYPASSPFGFNGRYWYANLSYRW
ncbi:MAG: TonB-dependent receptor [Rhodanobacter sp.]